MHESLEKVETGNSYTPRTRSSSRNSGPGSGKTPTLNLNMHSGKSSDRLTTRTATSSSNYLKSSPTMPKYATTSKSCSPRSRKLPEKRVKTPYTWPMERYRPATKAGRLTCSRWTITGGSSKQRQQGALTSRHRQARQPCLRRVVRCLAHQLQRQHQGQHSEDTACQWILTQQGQRQSALDVAS